MSVLDVYTVFIHYIIVILYYRQCLFIRAEYIRTSLKAAEVHAHCYVLMQLSLRSACSGSSWRYRAETQACRW